jgi:hypothetical protein
MSASTKAQIFEVLPFLPMERDKEFELVLRFLQIEILESENEIDRLLEILLL